MVVRLDGNFTSRLAAPAGLATPTGGHMYLIVDAATGDLMETGLGDKTVDITKLGATRRIDPH